MAATGKPKTGFPSTQWTDIHRWRGASVGERSDLLRKFYERYRRPLALYIGSRGYSSSEADDILHDFVMDHIQGRLFISADGAEKLHDFPAPFSRRGEPAA
jgi:hypothetical protein